MKSQGPENLDQAPSAALDAIVGEAREHFAPPDLDWSRLEAKLIAEVTAPPAKVPDLPIAAGGMALLAAAAAFALTIHDPAPPAATPIAAAVPVAPQAAPAGSLRETERLASGELVRIASVNATTGQIVRDGDTIEVADARAVFQRDSKVAWLLEPADNRAGPARARITQVRDTQGEPLIIGLESGVIEAQVTPVPAGEAFAVDVATEDGAIRVAVHGTHLRVARAGHRVVVDLTEGVIAIGLPSIGITQGTTVAAPAHVELDARDLSTIKIDRTAVRPALPIAVEGVQARPAAPRPPPPPPPLAIVHDEPASPPQPAAPKAEPPKPVVSPRDAVAQAVRDCASAVHASRRSEVHVTVTSSLRIKPLPSGDVLALFDPPLPPEIQSCAARMIHATTFEEKTPFTIPIEFSY